MTDRCSAINVSGFWPTNCVLSQQDEDVHYFTYRDLNRTTVSLILARSLEDLVDTENPRNVLKFKLSCEQDDGEDVVSSVLNANETVRSAVTGQSP